jgi:SHS2 domain-containing protein
MKEDPEKGYREIPHIADLAIEVWGKDWQDLLEAGLEGLNELLGCDDLSEQEESYPLSISSLDPQSLLIQFLNESLFYFEKGYAIKGVDIHGLSDKEVSGIFHVCKFQRYRYFIKAVTFHGKLVRLEKGCWRCQIVFDI